MTNQILLNGCALLDKDVATTLELPWAVRTYTADLWASRTYTPPDPGDLEGFDPADLLLVVDKTIKALDGASDVEIVLSAADEVATEVMDRLNRPWPEMPVEAIHTVARWFTPRSRMVLEIKLVDGDLSWCYDGERVCAIGGLGALT